MNKFLETYNQPKLNQKDINYLNRSIKSNEIEAAIKSLPKKKVPRSDGFSVELYQAFKQEPIPTLLKLFHEIEGKEHCQNHSVKPLLHSFHGKGHYNNNNKRELQANLFNELRCKNSQ
jgi:hypothetical protein